MMLEKSRGMCFKDEVVSGADVAAIILLRTNSFDLYLGMRRALVTQASDMVKAKVNAQ